jgi:hypothetical protein
MRTYFCERLRFIPKQAVANVIASANDDTLDGETEGLGGKRKKKLVILLSANRSQTIGVLLSHLKMPHEDFKRAITSLDARTLQPNFVVQLMKLLPTDQEVSKRMVQEHLQHMESAFVHMYISLSQVLSTKVFWKHDRSRVNRLQHCNRTRGQRRSLVRQSASFLSCFASRV